MNAKTSNEIDTIIKNNTLWLKISVGVFISGLGLIGIMYAKQAVVENDVRALREKTQSQYDDLMHSKASQSQVLSGVNLNRDYTQDMLNVLNNNMGLFSETNRRYDSKFSLYYSTFQPETRGIITQTQ